MQDSSIRTIVHQYYEAWTQQKKEDVHNLLDGNVDFRSPQDRFHTASDFLAKCWIYSQGLKAVRYLQEVYSNDQGFVILSWEMEDGSCFADAEYVRVEDGRIKQILVVNNSPEFIRLIE